MSNQRNLILAMVLSAALLFGWDAITRWYFPQAEKPVAEASSAAPAALKPTREGGLQDAAAIAEEKSDLKTALATTTRVPIKAPLLAGTINPQGARIDDLTLTAHREHLAKTSDPVRLFSPSGTPAQHFAQFGWMLDDVLATGPDLLWQASGGPLAPGKPVTLRHDNGKGQVLTIDLSVDDAFMLTARQTLANFGKAPVVAQPFATISRTSATASLDTWNVHSGPIGAFDGAVDFGIDYDDVATDKTVSPEGRTDWIGFTDIYWLSALVPEKGKATQSAFRDLGAKRLRADVIYQPFSVPAGQQISRTTRLFAGAKESPILARYEDAGIPNFSRTIDWGWFEILEKPILWLLQQLFALTSNFGVAIMLLTVVVRGAMFPIAQRQFASMAAMKAIQPKMKALQERYKDDKAKQQQEVMALYKAEGVNPLAGCMPLLVQIPIFFALYKVLTLTIEMRHQPFALWIKDLSAPDPLHFFNLFGMLPFEVPSLLALGPLALLLGVTMFLQFKLNPAQMDPVQQQMFMIMPWMMMFVMASFATGLLLYWCTSNILTIAQQKYLYSRHPQLGAQGVKDKIDSDRLAQRDAKGK